MKYYKWNYIILKDNECKEGEYITNLSASKICEWYESIGYKIIKLERICEMTSESIGKVPIKNLHSFASVIIYKEKERN